MAAFPRTALRRTRGDSKSGVGAEQASAGGRTRVLFVNTRDDLGADVAVHLLLARYLGAAGVDVTFAVNQQAADADKMLRELRQVPDVEIVTCPLGQPIHGRRGVARACGVLGNLTVLGSLWRLVMLVWRRRVDVLHATDRPRDAFLCALLGRLTGRPTVIHLHINYYPSMSRLIRWALKNCTCVVGVSDFTRRSVETAGLAPGRLVTVLNAVDAERFDPELVPRGQTRARWGIPAGSPLIAVIARLIPEKGHEDLLTALASRVELADVHLLVVGDENTGTRSYADALQARAAALGLRGRVRFTGLQDVRPIYADLDVLVVPSWDEPFGLVVVEAMAMRVPVVAYRAGGIPEIVRSGVEGLLVTSRSTVELADALVRLVADAELRVRYGAAGRRRVLEQFGPARQAAEIAALYRRVSRKAIRPDVAPDTS